MKVFFVLWFMMSSNTHTLTTMKFDTEAECYGAGMAMVRKYNDTYYFAELDESTFECLRVEVK